MIKNCYKETHIFCIFPCHFQFLIWIGLLLWANSTRHKINILFPEKDIPYFEHVIVHIKALGQALASNQSWIQSLTFNINTFLGNTHSPATLWFLIQIQIIRHQLNQEIILNTGKLSYQNLCRSGFITVLRLHTFT